jgi:serine/threonine protein kinase
MSISFRFFVEDKRLGMGAQGTVYLCRHVLNGNFLSYHAVKKIAVGKSKGYLTEMLREVRLLEGLRHKNIIPYEHIWVEPARFSRYAE